MLLVLLVITGDPELPPQQHHLSNSHSRTFLHGPTGLEWSLWGIGAPSHRPGCRIDTRSKSWQSLLILLPLLTRKTQGKRVFGKHLRQSSRLCSCQHGHMWGDAFFFLLRHTKNTSFEAAVSTNKAQFLKHCLKPKYGGYQTLLLTF